MCYVHVLFIFIIIMTRHGVEVIGSMEPNIEQEKTENISGDIVNSSCMCCVKQSRDIIVCNCNYYSEIKNFGCVNILQTTETNKN